MLLVIVFYHSNRNQRKKLVPSSWDVAVTNLTMVLGGWLWSFGLEKPFLECYCRNLGDNAESNAGDGGLAGKVSKGSTAQTQQGPIK